MKFELRKARRGEIFVRCLMFGESGQGKTYSALAVAAHLADLYGWDQSVIAVLDTETVESADRNDQGTGSAEKYAGRPCNCNRCHRQGLMLDGFQTMIMEDGHRGPEAFQRALEVCKQNGIRIVILDGITDEWRALLKLVDSIKNASRQQDGWSTARPLHNGFVRSLLEYPGHVIATCRAKKPSQHKKAEAGMGDVLPDQDGNVLYEYDVAVFFKRGTGHVVKTRDDRLEGATSRHPGADLAEGLKRWCDDPRAQEQSAAGQHAAANRLPNPAPNTRTDAGGQRAPQNGRQQPDPTPASAPSTSPQGSGGDSAGSPSPAPATTQTSATTQTTPGETPPQGPNGSTDPAAEARTRLVADIERLTGKDAKTGAAFLKKAGDDLSKLEKLAGWVNGRLSRQTASAKG